MKEIITKLKGHTEDLKAGLYFDAIFNDVEAQSEINNDSA